MGRGLHSENWKEEKVYYNYPTMKKTTRSFDVDYHLDWSYSVTIEQIKKDIEELEKLGATRVEIGIYDDHGDSYLDIKAISERVETDEEYQERVDEVKRRKEYEKHRELEELKRLKDKYGL